MQRGNPFMTDVDAALYPSLLERIDSPADLRLLSPGELQPLAEELRSFLIHTVGNSGGHFAAGLGTVELTVALHYIFDTPRDSLVWDVGHQCYPHKILTGRRDRLHSIRRRGGLSGFLKRDESPHDAFGAGHSSTSISAALGIAIANERLGLDRKAVAIIGDGGITGGLAYEALDHAGSLDTDLMVVLNDNQMSISPNVGALSDYLKRQTVDRPALGTRQRGKRHALKPRELLELADRAERRAQGLVIPGQWFEDLGFQYFGPIDGHDLPALLRVIRQMRQLKGPRLLHVVTRKGHGYTPAEADPVKYHGVTPFDPELGMSAATAKAAPTYTQVFGEWLCQIASRDSRMVAITPAMREGSGLVRFSELYPERYFDVGIAEQHSTTLAAGLASQGMRPVVAIYSTFLQRAYDQLIHDVALQHLPVMFAIDRAGLVGPDGATHTGAFDLSYLRCIPGMVVMTPADGSELRNMLSTGFEHDGPVAVRYPRASLPVPLIERAPQILPIGKAEVRRRGAGVVLLVFGTLLATALKVAETLDATVVNMRFVKPLDTDMVLDMAREHALVVTLEENVIAGGAGSAVGECLTAQGSAVPLLQLGLPDAYVEHGTREEALKDAGLDYDGILMAIRAKLGAPQAIAVTATVSRRPPGQTLCSTRRGQLPYFRRTQ
jgi:1-deoxy-D-xylulose-5-phosphate synthase